MLLAAPELSDDQLIGSGNVAVIIEYDGSHFHGWQFQKGSIATVAGALAPAIAKVANEPVELVCAGRTDAGVHASYQVVNFTTRSRRTLRSWVLGVNSALPEAIRVHWMGNVSPEFSARFAATERRYRYLIANTPVKPALFRHAVSWTHRPLDAAVMHQSGQCLLGEQDFSAFRAAGCQARTPHRHVSALSVQRQGHFVLLDITANAFLHHMVRNIAGSLMSVGAGEQPSRWIAEVLQGKDRRLSGITAPPFGLYLVDVRYPEELGIPRAQPGPSLLQQWPAVPVSD
ncbi:MAG: tRNA pseudouridine(38-40) synthase TruA [Halomonadaceae bacterium]|nr:MAG: tRNA pseudouridine(38-40) synthase TruA [Halomonadaceae bacterium]